MANNFPTSDNSSGLLVRSLQEHLKTIEALLESRLGELDAAGQLIWDALKSGHKILLCGNGGSAADAQHIAAELVGRYEQQRRAFPAIALTTDTSALTAIGNDYGFEAVFARQVEALAESGDVLIAISTSGKSPNIVKAADQARAVGCKIIALTAFRRTSRFTLGDLAVVVLRIGLRGFRRRISSSDTFGAKWLK